MMQIILALVLTIFGAQTVQGGENIPKAFSCVMPKGVVMDSRGAFENDEDGAGAFLIAAIDVEKGTAQLVGRAGASDLTVINGPYNVTFLEVTPAGNTTLTSVFPKTVRENEYFAVHSRHMGAPLGAVVSQYYGTCRGKW
jgi:hypothetical protein